MSIPAFIRRHSTRKSYDFESFYAAAGPIEPTPDMIDPISLERRPSLVSPEPSPTVDTSVYDESIDINSTIDLLKRLRELASPDELVALHRALLPVKDTSATPYCRRSASITPGRATRPTTHRQSHHEIDIFAPNNALTRPRPVDAQQSLTVVQTARPLTPAHLDVNSLGGLTLGTLRITNGTASPGSSFTNNTTLSLPLIEGRSPTCPADTHEAGSDPGVDTVAKLPGLEFLDDTSDESEDYNPTPPASDLASDKFATQLKLQRTLSTSSHYTARSHLSTIQDIDSVLEVRLDNHAQTLQKLIGVPYEPPESGTKSLALPEPVQANDCAPAQIRKKLHKRPPLQSKSERHTKSLSWIVSRPFTCNRDKSEARRTDNTQDESTPAIPEQVSVNFSRRIYRETAVHDPSPIVSTTTALVTDKKVSTASPLSPIPLDDGLSFEKAAQLQLNPLLKPNRRKTLFNLRGRVKSKRETKSDPKEPQKGFTGKVDVATSLVLAAFSHHDKENMTDLKAAFQLDEDQKESQSPDVQPLQERQSSERNQKSQARPKSMINAASQLETTSQNPRKSVRMSRSLPWESAPLPYPSPEAELPHVEFALGEHQPITDREPAIPTNDRSPDDREGHEGWLYRLDTSMGVKTRASEKERVKRESLATRQLYGIDFSDVPLLDPFTLSSGKEINV